MTAKRSTIKKSMTLRPIDGDQVSDAEIKALENPVPPKEQGKDDQPANAQPGGEPAKPPAEGEAPLDTGGKPAGEGGKETTPPFHENAAVQTYIERQVLKRVDEITKGGGNTQALLDRLDKLEKRITD